MLKIKYRADPKERRKEKFYQRNKRGWTKTLGFEIIRMLEQRPEIPEDKIIELIEKGNSVRYAGFYDVRNGVKKQLYDLQRQGLLQKRFQGKPYWRLSSEI